MTIEQSDTTDFVTIEKATGKALVTISDHLPWTIDEGDHLVLLQTKVYRDIDGIESGEIVVRYPQLKGRSFTIDIVSLHPLSPNGELLLNNAKQYLDEMGVELRWTLYQPKPKPANPPAPN